MLFKIKVAYSHWLKVYRRISKPERFGIGEKIDKLFLEVVENVQEMRFAPRELKITYVENINKRIDKLKLFCEMAWENELIKVKEYSLLLERLQEIGRELGGWKKSLYKTSQS